MHLLPHPYPKIMKNRPLGMSGLEGLEQKRKFLERIILFYSYSVPLLNILLNASQIPFISLRFSRAIQFRIRVFHLFCTP